MKNSLMLLLLMVAVVMNDQLFRAVGVDNYCVYNDGVLIGVGGVDQVTVGTVAPGSVYSIQYINNAGGPYGFMLSLEDGSLISNADWRCVDVMRINKTHVNFNGKEIPDITVSSISSYQDWMHRLYDDKEWPFARELGYWDSVDKAEISNKFYLERFAAYGSARGGYDLIDQTAKWIWSNGDGSIKGAGMLCRAKLELCKEVQCNHNGTCVNYVNRYACHCSLGYSGLHCESRLRECSVNPCLNAAPCYGNANDYECMCLSGYTGFHCETDVDECRSGPCENNGICIDRVDGYLCNCTVGYDGTMCEMIDACLSNPCQHGVCNNVPGGHVCHCTMGYIGHRCHIDFDECISKPCLNWGSCTHGIATYACECVEGYAGDRCEEKLFRNSDKLAEHMVKCEENGNSGWFLCECESGYTGRECETNIDDCADAECPPPSVCRDAVNNYTCGCPPGYKSDSEACNETCLLGFFGNDCSDECHCKVPYICDPTTGVCPFGCQPNYRGQYCNRFESYSVLEEIQNVVEKNPIYLYSGLAATVALIALMVGAAYIHKKHHVHHRRHHRVHDPALPLTMATVHRRKKPAPAIVSLKSVSSSTFSSISDNHVEDNSDSDASI